MKNVILAVLTVGFAAVVLTPDAYGIPAFARKYKTSCSTCHYAAPQLNGFGKAFFNNGYRFPAGTDPEMTKEEPVNLGAEGLKKVWPDAIWPADIPGTSPLSLWAIGRINYEAHADVKWSLETPHEVELLYGGTIGEKFSFFGEVEVENEDNETHISFPLALQYDYSPGFHIRAGMLRADPTPDHLKLTRNSYNISSFRSRNGWSFGDHHAGLEVWGAGNGAGERGGFTYRFGIVNGQGLTDINKQKDIYGKVTYKIGGLGEIGGTEGAENQTSRFYIDNNLTLGGFFYRGTASRDGEVHDDHAAAVLGGFFNKGPADGAEDEEFTVFGGDIDFWYDRFILNSALMLMNSDIHGTPKRKSMVYYVQGNGVIFPWLIGLVRYEWEDEDTGKDEVKPVNAVIPGITVMARPNVKIVLEFKMFLDEANKKNDTAVLQINFGI